MPTIRLGDAERAQIRGAFHRIMKRATNNRPFPLTEEDFPEFGYSLLDPLLVIHYEYLRENAPELTTASGWRPDFKVRSKEFVYKINLERVSMPKDGLLVPDAHPMQPEILEWAEHYYMMDQRVEYASKFLRGIVDTCSSTGQIRRVLSEDIIRFIPEYMQQAFKDAERRSRIPTNLCMDGFAEKLVDLADVLAIGSLSSEEQGGLCADVRTRTEI